MSAHRRAVTVSLIGIPAIPDVKPGTDLAALIVAGLKDVGVELLSGDVVVVTSKLVSKVEDRFVDLRTVTPSSRARQVAVQTGKDPRLVELILQESTAISRMRAGVLIVRHRLGFTLANAGIDHSNVGREGEWVLLLPEDPDRSAGQLRERLQMLTGVSPGIVISDSHGRPFRIGTVGVAIGVAGLPAVWDKRGQHDLYGRELLVTETGLGDELAAAAGLVTGQGAEGIPFVVVRGLEIPQEEGRAADLVRPESMDLYADHQETLN